jgi:hypothetical protein
MYSLKHIFSNTILILLLTTISSHAVAEWINISANSNLSTIYVDPATIQNQVTERKCGFYLTTGKKS